MDVHSEMEEWMCAALHERCLLLANVIEWGPKVFRVIVLFHGDNNCPPGTACFSFLGTMEKQ